MTEIRFDFTEQVAPTMDGTTKHIVFRFKNIAGEPLRITSPLLGDGDATLVPGDTLECSYDSTVEFGAMKVHTR